MTTQPGGSRHQPPDVIAYRSHIFAGRDLGRSREIRNYVARLEQAVIP